MTSTSYKIFFPDDNTRRLRVEGSPTYQEFVSLLKETFPSFFHEQRQFIIKYIDSDGDKIAISSEIEWTECFYELNGQNVLKFFVEDTSVQIKTETKTVQVLENKTFENVNFENLFSEMSPYFHQFANYFRENLETNKKEEDSDGYRPWRRCHNGNKKWGKRRGGFGGKWRRFGANKCGKRRGRCGRRFLNMSFEERRRFFRLREEANRCLNGEAGENILKAKDILNEMLKISPNHCFVLYNLCCVESILGNVEEALNNLDKAVDAGFRKLRRIGRDDDLNNIRKTERFGEIIKKLENKLEHQYDDEIIEIKQEEVKEEVVEEISKVETIVEIKVEELKKEVEEIKEEIKKEVEEIKEDIKKEVEVKIEEFYEFKEQIEALVHMGFGLSKDILEDLLKQCEGSLEKVINIILNY